jgi:hypothetical protein
LSALGQCGFVQPSARAWRPHQRAQVTSEPALLSHARQASSEHTCCELTRRVKDAENWPPPSDLVSRAVRDSASRNNGPMRRHFEKFVLKKLLRAALKRLFGRIPTLALCHVGPKHNARKTEQT